MFSSCIRAHRRCPYVPGRPVSSGRPGLRAKLWGQWLLSSVVKPGLPGPSRGVEESTNRTKDRPTPQSGSRSPMDGCRNNHLNGKSGPGLVSVVLKKATRKKKTVLTGRPGCHHGRRSPGRSDRSVDRYEASDSHAGNSTEHQKQPNRKQGPSARDRPCLVPG